MEHVTSLANVLRAKRLEHKLTQEALAAEVGISRSHVAMIETGGDLPGRDTLVALLNYFGLPLELIAASRDSAPGAHASPRAETPDEELWLRSFRLFDRDERAALLQYVLTRTRPSAN